MATTCSVAAALEPRVELQVPPAGTFMLLAARGAAPRPSRCVQQTQGTETRQPVGRLTSGLKMGTALDQPCAHLEERTDGADVRRRDRVLEFSRGSVTHGSSPCTLLGVAVNVLKCCDTLDRCTLSCVHCTDYSTVHDRDTREHTSEIRIPVGVGSIHNLDSRGRRSCECARTNLQP